MLLGVYVDAGISFDELKTGKEKVVCVSELLEPSLDEEDGEIKTLSGWVASVEDKLDDSTSEVVRLPEVSEE